MAQYPVDALQASDTSEIQVLRNRFSLALKSLKMGVWDWDTSRDLVHWDDSLFELYDLREKSNPLRLEDWTARIHPVDVVKVIESINASLNGTKDLDIYFRVLISNGDTRYIRCVGSLFKDSSGRSHRMVGLNWEITEEIKAREELENTRLFYRHVLDCVSDPIFVKDGQHRWLFGNQSFSVMTGLTREEYLGQSDFDLFPEDIAEISVARDYEAFSSGQTLEHEEVVQIPHGDRRITLTKRSITSLASGSKILVGVVRDITERKKAEKMMHNLHALIESSHDAFCYFDLSGNPLYLNKTLRQMGWSLNRRFLDELVDSDSSKAFSLEAFPKALKGEVWQGDIKLRDLRTSDLIPYSVKVFAILDDQGKIEFLAMIGVDLREKKAQELRLIHSSKLASLGEMAGQIAHEINNPLAIISGKSQQLRMKVKEGSISPEYVNAACEKIESTIDRIAKIIRSLRMISRQGDQEPFEKVDLKRVVEDVMDLCSERFRAAGLELRLTGIQTAYVRGRSTLLQQVLINLLNNAFDAIGRQRKPWIEVKMEMDLSMVTVSVIDCGPGLPPEIKKRIMEPFFTTKPVGKGTGLGLSISKSIIEEHSGTFQLDPSCANTRFFFSLPLAKGSL